MSLIFLSLILSPINSFLSLLSVALCKVTEVNDGFRQASMLHSSDVALSFMSAVLSVFASLDESSKKSLSMLGFHLGFWMPLDSDNWFPIAKFNCLNDIIR